MFAYTFLALFGLFHAVSYATNPLERSPSSTDLIPLAPRTLQLANRAPPTFQTEGPWRDIYIFNDMFPIAGVDPDTGETLMPSHSAIYIDGTEDDGPMKIEIAGDEDVGAMIRVLEFPATATGRKLRPRRGRTIAPQGQTAATNLDLFDSLLGRGVVADAWAEDPEFRNGKLNEGKLNVFHSLVTRILKKLGHDPSPDMQSLMDESNKYSVLFKDGQSFKILTFVHDYVKGGADAPNDRTVFMLKDGGTGKDLKYMSEEHLASFRAKVDEASSPEADRIPQADLVIEEDGGLADPAACGSTGARAGSCTHSGPEDPEVDLGDASDSDGSLRTSLARVGGQLQSFTALGKTALTVLGVAGDVVGAAFVILDFVNHNWVGAALGAFGLAAGVAIGLAISGPAGWILGGVIAALFAILPGLFKDSHPPGEITDVQGILQWSFFGDSTHTGNEQCQKGTSDVPGNPNCTALYGAGPLSMSLKLDNFDAIVFLIHVNQGYPMSLKEIAAAFTVVDIKRNDVDSNKHIAAINCNNRGQRNTKYGPVGDDPDLCNHPTYTINRDLIVLPGLNQTATEIYNRIIPAPGGDCKLLAYPGDQYFPSHNFTISGLPDAIACGLTSALNISGVAVPLNTSLGSDLPPPTVVSNGTDSTNGQNGAYIAPPPPSPFQPLLSSSYACLAVSPTSPAVCLPPGTYTPPHTSSLEIDLVHVTTLTFPPTSSSNGKPGPDSWSISLKAHTVPGIRGPPRPITRNYTTNQPEPPGPGAIMSTPSFFPSDITLVAHNIDHAASFTIYAPASTPDGPPNPVCCLFADPQFGADALCLGVGGGDLPALWQRGVVQSVRCHGGGWVWLYALQYGDDGATVVKGDVPDLKEVPYGVKGGSFSKNVKAAWVLKGD